MRNVVKVVLVLSLLAAIAGCSFFDTRPQVRFYNDTSDIVINYGIGFGDAKYSGSLSPGYVTDYYRTEAGTYYVDLKTSSGSWTADSTGSTEVLDGHMYTISIVGSYSGGYAYYKTMDE
jgi:hypothetical protein